MKEMILWYVFGVSGIWFATKEEAERTARAHFPSEDPRTRYARVMFKTVEVVK